MHQNFRYVQYSVISLCLLVVAGCGSDLGSFIPALTPAKKLVNPSFTVTLSSPGSSRGAIGVGDVTGDGKADLIVGLANGVDVFTAKGDNTYYQVPQIYSVGSNPSAISVGDLDGNGYNDIVTLNYNSNTLSVLLQSSTGFATAVGYATGANPVRLLSWDLNGDGVQDFVTLNSGSNTVSVLMGVPATKGTYAAKVDYATGSTPSDFCIADFNGDGIPDLAVLNAGDSSVSILLGKANGTFQIQTVTTGLPGTVSAIGCGDFTHDGKADVAFSTTNGGTIEGTVDVLVGKGDGTFETLTPRTMYNAGTISGTMLVGDFDGDGILDVAVSSSLSTINILTGKSTGTFSTKQIYPTNNVPATLLWTDINGDGIKDWATIANGGSSVAIYLGK